MNKKLIRLTESDIRKIVKESVERIVKESHNNEILDALHALQIALNDVLESCSSKTSRINQWATRVSQEADEIVNKYETQLNSYDSDPYKKMGRMDIAI